MNRKVVVTGGGGKVGRAVVVELLEHGYSVLNADAAPQAATLGGANLRVDFTDYGETVEALAGAWGVVHLAAIPAPNRRTPARTFRDNVASTFNVFQAAALHKLTRVVWASSETTIGLPFHGDRPAAVPVDESHYPLPESAYALSKVVGETMAEQFARWTGTPHIGLRFSYVQEPADHDKFMEQQKDPTTAMGNLWSYVDARDCAQATRLALEVSLSGSTSFLIAAADTRSLRPSNELMAEYFPQCRVAPSLGTHQALISSAKAERVLGYRAKYSWRDWARTET